MAEEGVSRLPIAGHAPGLDEGGPLPVLAHALVIGLGGEGGDGGGRGARVGAQPQIGAEDVAVGCALAQHATEIAGQAREVGLKGIRIRRLDSFAVEQQDQVDIARIIELARAQLAHAEDDEAGAWLDPLGIGEGEGAGRGRVAQERPGGGAEGGLGQAREGIRHPFESPGTGNIGQCDGERGAPLGLA